MHHQFSPRATESTLPKENVWLISLNMAFVLDEIWYYRNQAFHQGIQPDIQVAIDHIHHRFAEFTSLMSVEKPPTNTRVQHTWIPPPTGWIKFNIDVAISNKAIALAAIARNDKGDVLKVWAKLHTTCSLFLVEASAILWAVQLARTENWNYIIFEGDAKAALILSPLLNPLLTGLLATSFAIF